MNKMRAPKSKNNLSLRSRLITKTITTISNNRTIENNDNSVQIKKIIIITIITQQFSMHICTRLLGTYSGPRRIVSQTSHDFLLKVLEIF